MALRKEIKTFRFGDVKGSYWVDTGMEPGGENYVVVEFPNGESLARTFYFEENSRHHCRNFVKKLAEDKEYRRRCLEGEVTWAKVGDAYFEASKKVHGAFQPVTGNHWENQYEKAKDQSRAWCETLYERLTELFEEVEDPSEETIETVVEEVSSEARAAAEALRDRRTSAAEPKSVHYEMDFGKHSGKTLLEIASKHRDYAEWAAEELTNRPEVRKGFVDALNRADEES